MSEEVQIGECRLIFGDCREVLPTLPKHDLLLTDPPYGIGADKGKKSDPRPFNGSAPIVCRHYPENEWDNIRPDKCVILTAVRSANVAIVWGGNYFSDWLTAQGRWLWWDKCQTMPSYGDGELAWTNLPQNTPKKFTLANNKIFADRVERYHPTQKPLPLMLWCLSFAPEALTVLDPFAGSGTTGVACARMGLQFTGIERERKYFDIACERISRAQAQGQLLPPEETRQPVQEGLL